MILVTGSSGFIGHHVVKGLLPGHEIMMLDKHSSYYSVELKRLRDSKIKSLFGINNNILDLSIAGTIKELALKFPISTIVHLAAQPGIRLSEREYDKYVEDNLVAFVNLIRESSIAGINNIIFASSSSVYGNKINATLKESESSLKPISFYGATKLNNEVIARTMAEMHGMRIFALRFFTVYGPWGRPDMAYFRIANSILSKVPFALFGNGNIQRDFTYISDIVQAISALIKKIESLPLGTFEIFNIGGGKPYSLNELINEFEVQLERKIVIRYFETNKGDVQATNADWTKLERFTGLHPVTSLKDGITEFLKWATHREIIGKLDSWCKSVN